MAFLNKSLDIYLGYEWDFCIYLFIHLFLKALINFPSFFCHVSVWTVQKRDPTRSRLYSTTIADTQSLWHCEKWVDVVLSYFVLFILQ